MTKIDKLRDAISDLEFIVNQIEDDYDEDDYDEDDSDEQHDDIFDKLESKVNSDLLQTEASFQLGNLDITTYNTVMTCLNEYKKILTID